jgi:hypothetical protein
MITTLEVDPAILEFVRALTPGAAEPELVRQWRSSKADLYHFRFGGEDVPGIVVKRAARGEPAPTSFAALSRLADFVEASACPSLSAVRPLGFDAALDAIAMPYIDGTLGGVVVRGETSQLESLVERVAVLMAEVHRLSRVAFPDQQALAVADQRLTGLTVAAHVGPNRPHPGQRDLVRRLIDFNPNNIVLRPDGDLCLFDPHVFEGLFVYIHQDIAAFLYKTYKRLISRPWNATRMSHASNYRRQVDRFLRTYFACSERPMDDLDAKVVGACLDGYTRLSSTRERGRHRIARLCLNDWLLRREAHATLLPDSIPELRSDLDL